jgi:hypothetical protein
MMSLVPHTHPNTHSPVSPQVPSLGYTHTLLCGAISQGSTLPPKHIPAPSSPHSKGVYASLHTFSFQYLQPPILPRPLPPPPTHATQSPASMGSLGIVQAPALGPPAQESPRLLRPGLRPFPIRPFPSPKLGLLRCAVEDRPEGGASSPPSPRSHPAFSRAGRSLVFCMVSFFFLLLSFFLSFFFSANFARAPAARHSPATANSPVDWAHAPLRSAPLYPQRTRSFRTPRSRTGSAGDGG